MRLSACFSPTGSTIWSSKRPADARPSGGECDPSGEGGRTDARPRSPRPNRPADRARKSTSSGRSAPGADANKRGVALQCHRQRHRPLQDGQRPAWSRGGRCGHHRFREHSSRDGAFVRYAGTLGRRRIRGICPGTGLGAASDVAEAMRARLARQAHPGVGIRTCSIGVAEHGDGEDLDAFLAWADDALYAAKRNGRDQVCVSPGAEMLPERTAA